ncbi:peptidoglycan-binding protein [Streptomyces zaomyceticus]|uniref:peptidoglycan-binding protein n=1 Tax=Streptomyces zaomyceticus TaxID=68286 RepID=UPI0037AE4BCD
MTGHACPECGVQRPGCACAQAEIAAAEDFDPLRIRPYVTLDAPGDVPGGADGVAGGIAGGVADPASGGAATGSYAAGGTSSYGADDPPTAQLAAIRPDQGPVDMTAPMPAVGATQGAQGAQLTHGTQGPQGPQGALGSQRAPWAGTGAGAGYPGAFHPEGDPSETMPLLLRGAGDVPPPPGHESGRGRGRGRGRGAMVAAVAAVAVAGTAALAAAMLGGGDDSDNRAAVPEVTTSASLNLGVSEAPSPSAKSPEPTSSSPTPRETSSSPTPSSTPSATGTTASASTTGAATPSVDPSSTTNAPTTPPPATKTPPAASPEGEEEGITLSLGSTGQEVRELQRRLTAVWVYDGRINGRYDEEVRDAVARYQSWRYIPDDPEGVYGPDTRRILEENTPDI